MQFIVLIFLFLAIVFLFNLYVFSKEDFILFRKNVYPDKIYNLFFIILGIGLFGARLVYVIFHFQSQFLNPFIFILFPYFPGMSLSGGIAVGFLGLFLISKKQKLPAERLLDLFSLSTALVISLFFLLIGLELVIFLRNFVVWYFLLFLVFSGFYLSLFKKIKIADLESKPALIFLIFYSLTNLAVIFFTKADQLPFDKKEIPFHVLVFIITFFLFAKRQKLVNLLRR